jgi:hypothetical protein
LPFSQLGITLFRLEKQAARRVLRHRDRPGIQAIGRLRKVARDEIDRPIRLLGKTDNYVLRELEESNANELPL